MTRVLERDLLICLTFYSRLPLRVLTARHRPWGMEDFGSASRMAPLAGAVLGGIGAAVLALCVWPLGYPAWLAAVLGVATSILITGALHEDGLADLADGFGGGASKARKLEIMRDSRLGTFGVLALLLAVTLRIGLLALVLERYGTLGGMLAMVAAAALSRGFGLLPLALLPPARTDGLAHRAGRIPPRPLFTAIGLSIGLGTVLPALGGITPWRSLLACGVSAAACYGVTRLAERQIGGQTGDVSGAAQQIGEIAFWLFLCLAPTLG